MLDCLYLYASMGWPLFPVCAENKKPFAGTSGHKDATCDRKQIETWHQQYAGCAWAVATASDWAALDVDPRHNGDKHLAALEAQHGPLPPTPRVLTGGGGHHHWFKCPPGTSCRSIAKSDSNPRADSITLKAEGGYVIVPPSKIAVPEHQGRPYVWEVRPWELPLVEAPAWLLATKPKTNAKANAGANAEANDPWVVQPACPDLLTHPGADSGKGEQRRPMLVQMVGVHLARGDSQASIKAMAEAWADRCKPPLEEKEWLPHVERLCAKENAKAGRMTPLPLSPPSQSPCPSPEGGREGNNSGLEHQTSAEAVSPAQANAEAINPAQASPSAEAQAEFVPSLPVFAESGQRERRAVSFDWPKLGQEAYHGFFGEMLRAIEPETEADPVGILLGWLTCFGSIVGRGAWVQVGPRRHHPGLYVGIVGKTSDAKGDSWAASLWPFKEVEPAWAGQCIANGVGSGEGLIERIADAQTFLNRKGEAEARPGATDKRCLLRLSELSRCFKLGRRENATLSEYMREGWDGEPIHVPNRSGNALSASGYAISMVGDITPGMVRKLLESGTEAFDGFANRFLWACVRSPRSLPSGGSMAVLRPYLEPLQSAIAFTKGMGELKRDAEADALWADVYPSLKRSGDDVPHTDRARPYALRLAMLYALADSSRVIKADHLRAALAVWEYCRQSAKLIFVGQEQTEAHPDPLWLQLLNAISKAPGVNRTGLREVAGHKAPAQEIEVALGQLEAQGMAHRQMVHPDGGGRPAECWYPGPEPGEKVVNDTAPFSPSPPKSQGFEPQPEAGNMRREGTNSAQATAVGTSAGAGREGTNSGSGEAWCDLPKSEASGPAVASAEGERREPEGELLSSLPPSAEVEAASEAGKKEGRVIHQPEPPFAAYPTAESVEREVYRRGGRIIKLDNGQCELQLPEPDLILEGAWEWFGSELCAETYTDADFLSALANMPGSNPIG